MKSLVLSDGSVFFTKPSYVGPIGYYDIIEGDDRSFEVCVGGAVVGLRFKTLAEAVEGRNRLLVWAGNE